jgi:L-asparaginase/Glu-tRNA(Gln) amidotransferase subunit D
VESFGAGNIPTEGPFYEWFKKNSEKDPEEQAIIINISQVYQSVILNIYATGDMAHKLGMIPGGDMTTEAASAKLSYLATLYSSDPKKIRELMAQNLRG